MKVFLGIDLGSTTTKAVLVSHEGEIVGRGLTNTRANFETACSVAQAEAMADARLSRLPEDSQPQARATYVQAQRKHRLMRLRERALANEVNGRQPLHEALTRLFDGLGPMLVAAPQEGLFQSLVQGEAPRIAEQCAGAVPYEMLMGAFERALVVDEIDATTLDPVDFIEALKDREPIDIATRSGTGYGRHRLPFEKNEIRSEILCHGLGARHAFPNTRTVLDIGGQDTKAIQLDEQGFVSSFQMNDRCAAGCGRYLGYVAEELGVPLFELAALALGSRGPSQINSTCTVFAGAEIRDRLALGEKREDVVAGLHRAIVLRALGLLARSGGIRNELTFSGGVARNGAVVRFLHDELARHYGGVMVNVSPDGIFNGAIGAALFSRMEKPC